MKNFSFLLLSLIFSNQFASANPCNEYLASKNAINGIESTSYLMRGKPNDVKIDWNYIVYPFESENLIVQAGVEGDLVLTAPFHEFLANGFLVKKLSSPISPQRLQEIRKLTNGKVWVSAQHSSFLGLLTPYLIVGYKPEMTAEEIAAFNTANKISIMKTIPVAPNTYNVVLDSENMQSSVDVANQYMASGKVVFAEPVFSQSITYRHAHKAGHTLIMDRNIFKNSDADEIIKINLKFSQAPIVGVLAVYLRKLNSLEASTGLKIEAIRYENWTLVGPRSAVINAVRDAMVTNLLRTAFLVANDAAE